MCKNFNEHFKKYNQWYSFGLLLILTLLVVFLFLRLDALETDVDRQLNDPSIDHQLTKEQLKKKAGMDNVPTEVTVSGEVMPGTIVPGAPVPSEPTPPMPNNVQP